MQILGDGEAFVNVKGIIPHPLYNKTSNKHDFDFALLHLAKAVELSNNVNLACLPPGNTKT